MSSGESRLSTEGVEPYARASAAAAGLSVDEAWWPDVLGHLAGLLAAAASVEEMATRLPDDPAPVFCP